MEIKEFQKQLVEAWTKAEIKKLNLEFKALSKIKFSFFSLKKIKNKNVAQLSRAFVINC